MTAKASPRLTATQRATFTAALDLVAATTAADERTLGVAFPYVTAPDGTWQTMLASRSAGYDGDNWSHGNWFCGFWVGLLLAAHLQRGDAELLDLALERLTLVAARQDDPNTHDIGFIFLSSAIPAFHVTGDRRFAAMGLRAAERLRARLVTTERGAYLAAWGPLTDPRGKASSAIDTMANLRLLYWAAQYSGDASFLLAGEAHARMTRGAFIRQDLTTYHAVEYDPLSGERRRGYTFQGYADESCWSRGQGWAILGYAETAAATGYAEHLELAGRLADVFFDRLGDAAVPPWDFDDPAGPAALRDSAAGTIVANGLLTMAELLPEGPERTRRFAQAVGLLENLCREALATEAQHRGVLRHGCYSQPHSIGIDSAVLFGDYYFVEALARLILPGRLVP